MEVLVEHHREIRADIVSSCDHGWVNDKLDSGTRECNLMENVGSKFVDDLVLLLPLPLDIKTLQDEATDNEFRTGSEEDAMDSNIEVHGASSLEIDGHDVVKPVNAAHSISLPVRVVTEIKSAMKGSRQKHGLEMKRQSVSWAPDVYDPPVTSQCHLVKASPPKQSRVHKKSSKHKQKGKSIRNGRKVKK